MTTNNDIYSVRMDPEIPWNNLATYPADEEEMHDLYSDKCKCKPETELWGITTIFMHNSFNYISQRRKAVEKAKASLMAQGWAADIAPKGGE